jgi:hypothetical protein
VPALVPALVPAPVLVAVPATEAEVWEAERPGAEVVEEAEPEPIGELEVPAATAAVVVTEPEVKALRQSRKVKG